MQRSPVLVLPIAVEIHMEKHRVTVLAVKTYIFMHLAVNIPCKTEATVV